MSSLMASPHYIAVKVILSSYTKNKNLTMVVMEYVKDILSYGSYIKSQHKPVSFQIEYILGESPLSIWYALMRETKMKNKIFEKLHLSELHNLHFYQEINQSFAIHKTLRNMVFAVPQHHLILQVHSLKNNFEWSTMMLIPEDTTIQTIKKLMGVGRRGQLVIDYKILKNTSTLKQLFPTPSFINKMNYFIKMN
eukprot:7241_1